ncbi:hypothetical protein BGW38_008654 [Lunasporangiospora selenospora]|uniref:Uncharacterized protein n=1 Tax=Lunasporangiospora selenospora TaxID=979761 RepID=A0A9P6FKZ9_9FUNG|nr:hypothetical protein BGW38_008654 [Lunasporangiospora selenospora]
MRVPTPVPAVKNKKSRKSLRSRDSTTPDSDQDTAEESPDRESSVYQPSEIFTSLPPEIRQMEEQVQKLLRIANEAGVDKQRHQRFQQLWQRDDTQEPVESLFIGDDLTPNMIVEADKFEEDIGSDQSDTHPDDEKAALAQDALAWGEDQNEIWENYRRVVHPPTAHSCRPNSITRERDHDPVENAGESDERLVKQVFKEIEQGGPIYTAWSDGVPEHELKHSVREMVYQERNIHRSVNYNRKGP